MKIRRKAAQSDPIAETPQAEETTPVAPRPGPYDVSEVPDDIERVDIGALKIAPVEGLELRLQVNESTEEVGAAMLGNEEGALELHVYSAPSSGGLWDEVRPQIAEDVVRRGGEAEEHEGPFGVELRCTVPVRMPDGQEGYQPSRVVAVEGRRWMLRGTMLGRPALQPEEAGLWEHALRLIAVERGDQAMPVGQQLPLTLPADARPL